MKKLLVYLLMVCLLCSILAGCQNQSQNTETAQTKEKEKANTKEEKTEPQNGEKEYLFKYAHQKNEKHPRGASMVWFKDELEKRTNGQITVEVYHSGVLGKEQELFQMTVTGALQGYRGAGYEQLTNQFNLWNVPFLFQNYEEVSIFQKSEFCNNIKNESSKEGIYIPAVGYTGFRNLINKKTKIEKPDDLKGLKMRSPGQAPIINFYKTMGAYPQEMNFSEVYMALKTGVVDGVCSSASDLWTNKIYEVAQHFTLCNYMGGADPFMVNMEWYNSLPDNLKKIFDEVSIEALEYSDKKTAELENQYANELEGKTIDTVRVHDDSELSAEWVEACKPLWNKFIDDGIITKDDLDKTLGILQEFRQ